MNISLHSTDLSELVLQKHYPENYSTAEVAEFSNHMNYRSASVYYKETYFSGIRISYAEINLKEKARIYFESDFETIEMHFALKGRSSTGATSIHKHIQFADCQHNIIYANEAKGTLQLEDKNICVFEVNLLPSVFLKYFSPELTTDKHFYKNIQQGISSTINQVNRTINPLMYKIIDDIIHCNKHGVFKKLYLESRVLELLMLQLENFSSTITESKLKKTDTEKIHAVKDYILKNTNNHLSLSELAKSVGTNEFTLKKGFKELFGTSVFSYWSDLKMEEAHKMLIQDNQNINVISDYTGYKNPQHFSAAFKKKYGILPSQLRKLNVL